MFWNRKPKPDPAMEMAKLFAATLEQHTASNLKVIEVISATSLEATKAALATTEVLQKHLDLFRVPEDPSRRIVRDEDEYAEEVERLKASGFPIDVEPVKQLEFVNENLNIETLTDELGI